MPKLPRTGGKASTGERATKSAAKPAAASSPKPEAQGAEKRQPASRPKAAANKDGTAATAKRRRSTPTNSPAATAKGAAPAKKQSAANGGGNGRANAPDRDFRHRPVDKHDEHTPAGPKTKLTDGQRVLLGDLFAVVEEHRGEAAEEIDRDAVERAFLFSCERHADQRRASGEDFIVHPVGVAKICAGMRLDTATLCAALLHDTVEDTSASLDEVREAFGEEVAGLVDGVTKLTGITFQSRDEAQAENYRKMMVAMATDVRVILIKLADRLHNMRTLGAMPKQKQIEKAKETLDIYAPLAHRLGIHAIKWELEDLSFATLHPRKYQEIKGLVNQQREEREHFVA